MSWIFDFTPSKFKMWPLLTLGMGMANPELGIRPIFQENHRDGEQKFLGIFEGGYKPNRGYEG